MHMFKRLSALIIICFFFVSILHAQTLEYSLKYDGIADNREYFSPHHDAETIFGSRLGFALGTSIDSIHQFRAGLSYFYEFGGSFGELPPHLIMYYSVDHHKWAFKIGAFPRKENIPYPNALISEKYEYYNPIVDGLWVKHKSKNGNFGLFADWVSRQDSNRREQFIAGFFGNLRYGNFTFEDYFYLFHKAGRIFKVEGEHIEDSMGAIFLLGYDFSDKVPLDILSVKTGTMSSAFRNRGDGSDFDINTSSYSEVVVDYKGFGLEAFLKFGSPHHFEFGSNYYNSATNYVRTRFYFTPINLERIQGRFMYSLHFTAERMDHQQQFLLSYMF